MPTISTKLRRNLWEVTMRVKDWAYNGRSPFGIAPEIACLSGESVYGLGYTSTQPTPATPPSGLVSLIGTDGTSANNVVLGGTGAGNVLIGSSVVPTAEHSTFLFAAASAVSIAAYPIAVALQLIGVQICFGTASASGTVTVEHLTGTQAAGGGTALLTVPLSTAGAPNTYLTGTLIATLASLQFAAGDRLGIVFGGSQTGLVGLSVSVTFKRI